MDIPKLLQNLAAIGSILTPIIVLILSGIGWKYRNSIEAKLSQYFEVHKQKIKNSEFFFQKQFDASQQLYEIKVNMMPPYRHPDMDWYEAIQEMANNLGKTHISLRKFLINHFTILSPEILEKLELAAANAEEGSLFGGGEDIREPGNQCAERVYSLLKEATSQLKAEVDGQRHVEFHEFTKNNS